MNALVIRSLVIIFSLLLFGCSSNNGWGNGLSRDSLSFHESKVVVTAGSDRELILTLSGGATITDLPVDIRSSNTAVVTVKTPSICTMSTSPSVPTAVCRIYIHGTGTNGNAARIIASAVGYVPQMVAVTISSQIQPGILRFSESGATVVKGSNNHVFLTLAQSSGVNNLTVNVASSNSSIAHTTPTNCVLSSGVDNFCELAIIGTAPGQVTLTASATGALGTAYRTTMSVSVTGSSPVYGTIAFNTAGIGIPESNTKTVILSLNNSSDIVNDVVNLVSANPGVATLNANTCTLSSDLAKRSCDVIVTGKSLGSTQIKATSVYNGYTYTIAPLNINVTNGMSFTTAVQGLSNTIYSNTPYPSVFIFTNTSSNAVSLGKTGISMPAPLNWQLAGSGGDACSNKTIPSGESCSISGTLSLTNPQTGNNISITLNSSDGNSSYNYIMDEYAAQFKSGYAALRVKSSASSDGNSDVFLLIDIGGVASDVGAHPVQYALSAPGIYTGTIITHSSSGAAPSVYTIELPVGNTIFYTPPMMVGPHLQNAGSRMYVSYGESLAGVAGNQPHTVQNVPYVLGEYNIPQNLSTVLDVSYVNTISVPIAVTGTQQLDGSVAWTNIHAGVKTQYYALSGTDIMQAVKTGMNVYTGAWNVPAYFQTASDSSLLAILSPATVFTSPTTLPTGFESGIFNIYFNDVWNNYYNQPGHSFLINGVEIANQLNSGVGESGCYIAGHVESDNLMHFAPENGHANCPTGAYTINHQTYNSGPNTFTIPVSELNYYSFFAAFADQSIFGVNGTYKSLSKYMAGAWAVGFLPFCGHDNIAYTKGSLLPYFNNLFTPQYSCLPNYSSYGPKTLDQYDKQVHIYFDSYGYGYDDTIGIDSTITTNGTVYPMTIYTLKYKD